MSPLRFFLLSLVAFLFEAVIFFMLTWREFSPAWFYKFYKRRYLVVQAVNNILLNGCKPAKNAISSGRRLRMIYPYQCGHLASSVRAGKPCMLKRVFNFRKRSSLFVLSVGREYFIIKKLVSLMLKVEFDHKIWKFFSINRLLILNISSMHLCGVFEW